MSELATVDRLDVLELVARYAQAMDAHDLEVAADCFLPDAVLRFASRGIELVGVDAIMAFYRETFAGPRMATGSSTHAMANSILTADGGDVLVSTQAVVHLAPEGTGQISVRGLTYHDRCRRGADGRWRFAERTHRLRWQGSIPGGPLERE